MARDEKLIYQKPVAIPLGGLEKASGVTPHCKSGTIPGPPNGEGDCGNGTYATSQQQIGCYNGVTAFSQGPTPCVAGTSPTTLV